MGSNAPEYGKRLIPVVVDEKAAENPSKAFAAMPIDDDDLSKGFKDITFKQMANAINRAAHWLDDKLGKTNRRPGDPFETFAYLGGRDLRYVIFLIAAVKVGRRILVPSLLAAHEAQVHLANSSNCKAFLHSGMPQVPAIQKAIPGAVDFVVPTLEEFLFGDAESPVYPYTKTFDEAAKDQICIFHTSGSSGFPKLVFFTHEMMIRMDKLHHVLTTTKRPLSIQAHQQHRMFAALPVFHVAGIKNALSITLFFNSIPVFGPADKPVTPELADQVHRYGNVQGGFYPPALVEDLVRETKYLERLAKMKTIAFGGAPLSKFAGNALCQYGSLRPTIGSTEGGYWPSYLIDDPKDWEYFEFHEVMSIRYDHHVDDFYEMVVERTPLSEQYTLFFDAVPDAGNEFRTKDLWSRHPDPKKPNLWKYEGRTDDLIVLTGEVKMYAGRLEERLRAIRGIKHALVGGQQRQVPFLLVEAVDPPASGAGQEKLLNELWPAIEEENKKVLEHTRLQKQSALVAPKDKPFLRLAKGSVDRRNTLKNFAGEIDTLYEMAAL